ncbi:MAG: hypothetical protein AAF909_04900 [Pseudomonadota bacterium]
MREVSLGFPYLLYLVAAAMLVGMALAPLVVGAPPPPATAIAGAAAGLEEDHGRMASRIEVDPAAAPALTISVSKDAMSGWNLKVDVERFAFTPADVNGTNAPNAGHAHIYVNRERFARLYGPDFHLPDFAPGAHEILVSLNANDHAEFTIGGKPIYATATIVQE